MFRLRVAGMLAAVALLAAACGDDGGQAVAPDEPQGQPETPTTTAGGPDDSSEADGTGTSEAVTSTTAAAESDGPDGAAPVDAEALLASAATSLDGRSFRGEAVIEVAPGLEFTTSLESDADGDLAVWVELLLGEDTGFSGRADTEMRYVGCEVYVRPAVTAETLAELGVDEAWYVDEPIPGGDAMRDSMAPAGLMWAFPQMLDGRPAGGCNPLGDTQAFLAAASEAEIVGREDVRGVETTRVRFLVSLLDLAGDVLGAEPDDGGGTSEAGAFDDTASDPFAEGLDQIFGFLDADLEAEVWIDDEGLIRRLTYDLASLFAGLAGLEAGEMPSSLVTLEFYDFDAAISVDAPPPEVIVDDPSLIIDDDDYATSEEYDPYDDDYDDYDDDYN